MHKPFVRDVETHVAVGEMGVATSEDATAGTKFKFRAPVYLQPGEWYASF